MKLGERLREIRKQRHLTLKELSDKADLSVPYLSDLEREKVNPSVDTLSRIAQVYEMTLNDLLSGVDIFGESTSAAYPPGFVEFLKEYKAQITDDWEDLLLKIDLRGKRPASKDEWIELYLHLRRILEPV